MKKILFATLLASFACAAGAQAGLDFRGKMKEGMYETSVKMEMPGMPQGMGNMGHTTKKCTTKEDLEKGKDMFRDPKQANNTSCELKNVKQSGNTMTYDMDCPKEGMTSTTTLAFNDSNVKGVTKMKMSGEKSKGMPPGMGEMTMNFESKYLGACTK